MFLAAFNSPMSKVGMLVRHGVSFMKQNKWLISQYLAPYLYLRRHFRFLIFKFLHSG